jgi:hypothetical protein
VRRQPRARLRGRAPQRLAVDLDRRARDRRALVRRARSVTERDMHIADRDVELFGDDLRQRRREARAEIDVAMQRGDAAVVPHRDQRLGALGGVCSHGGRLARHRRRRGHGLARDQQHTERGAQLGAREARGGAMRHAAAAVNAAA